MDALQTRRAPLTAPARLRAAALVAGCLITALMGGCAWLEPLPEDGRSLSNGVNNTIEDFAGPERSNY
jgi:hypothetical protein